jgi:hypothetical protein
MLKKFVSKQDFNQATSGKTGVALHAASGGYGGGDPGYQAY